ncbi:hypothetical protein SBV1_790032 [Verrucomicrobia bacterium]|nr:hypothetical protein SBV1_790032 [Verrucomicrobiota bacterium]
MAELRTYFEFHRRGLIGLSGKTGFTGFTGNPAQMRLDERTMPCYDNGRAIQLLCVASHPETRGA